MDEIPIINCSKIVGSFESLPINVFEKFANEFGKSLSEIGFVYLVNHDVDMKKVNKLYEISREFFALPLEIKRKYRKIEPLKCFNGYSGPGDEFLNEDAKNVVELKELWDVWGKEGYNDVNFPSEIPGFKNAFDEFRIECINLTWKLLRSLGIYLKLEDPDFLLQHHRGLSDPSVKTQSQIRSLYYFPLDNQKISSDAVRCGAHSDWGTITLNFQDMCGGLEVQTANGQWIEATPIENAILVNAAQLLEFWSGGRIHAAPHRVQIKKKEQILNTPRQSIIYFVDPDGDTKVEPIIPIISGKEYLGTVPPLVAYEHSQRLIKEVMSYKTVY